MLDRRVSGVALLLLPAALVAYLAFNAGGYFPTAAAYVAIFLAVVLALRMVGSIAPFDGGGPWLTVASSALGLFALVTLMSEVWSHVPGQAFLAFDVVLVYLLVMVLFGLLGHRRNQVLWMIRVLAGTIFVICAIALITRLLPRVWPTSPNIANNRLSYPVTYWNVLGLLAVFGILLCTNFACRASEPIFSRVAGAAALPILASTLFFTFSRGSIAVCIIGLVVYVLIARPRGLLSVLLTAVPATAIALKVDYDANLLATLTPTTRGAVQQGHHVAVVVVACAAGAGLARAVLGFVLDTRLSQLRLNADVARRASRVGWAVLTVGFVVAALGLRGTISHEYHQFLRPPTAQSAVDLRARLTDPSNNGRVELWKVAWHQFEAKPFIGAGAGTYQDTFLQHRYTNQYVVNAHSLYLETLDELGVLGLALLLVAIVTIMLRTALRCRGRDRPLYAAIFALMLTWALESGIDWDWQMPVVTIVVFALGGLMLAREPRTVARDESLAAAQLNPRLHSPTFRTALGLACLLLAVAPAYVWLSQRKLNQADLAFGNGNYRAATDDALSSISILGIRPEAYELVAYSDLQRGMPGLALRAMRTAVSLDRNNWNYAYGLALMQAADGLNPLPEARRALTLNPREPLAQIAWETFKTDTPSGWPGDARTMSGNFTGF